MPTIFHKYYPLRKIVFILGEGLLIFLSLLLVDRFLMGAGLFNLDFPLYSSRSMLVTLIFQLCLYFFDLYDLSNEISMVNTITRMTQAFGVGCIMLGIVYYTVPFMIISGKIFWLGYVFICASVFAWRGVYYLILRKRLFVQNVLVVGCGQLAVDIAREIEGVKDSVYKIAGFVGPHSPEFNPHAAPVRPNLEDYTKALEAHEVERIIVALDDRRGATPVAELLKWKMLGIGIEQGSAFFERITGKVPVDKIAPSWIIFSSGFFLSRWTRQVKRMLDLAFASLLLLLTSPVLVVTAILIRLEGPGPIFYVQERVGERNRIFRLIKFRSMCLDAEKDGAVWAKKNDDRVTRVGAFIRRVRIDEIPQLFNVIKGEMSLVGPRPERQVFVEQLARKIPFYSIRHEVKPGVTGWAQVCYPYGASELDALRKLEYDLYYMKNISIALDLLIIFRTIKTVLCQKGAR